MFVGVFGAFADTEAGAEAGLQDLEGGWENILELGKDDKVSDISEKDDMEGEF